MSKEINVIGKLQKQIKNGVKNCVGYGTELTKNSQNVVYYAKGRYYDVKGLDSDESNLNTNHLGDRINRIKNYINEKTCWNLMAGYADIVGVSFHNYQDVFGKRVILSNQVSLKSLLDDIQKNRIKVDIIVVENISQITRDIEELTVVLEKVFSKHIVIYCIDSENVITLDSRILDGILPRKSILDFQCSNEPQFDFEEVISNSSND